MFRLCSVGVDLFRASPDSRALTGVTHASLTSAGPSFPAKRTREPASFANGVYRPILQTLGRRDLQRGVSPMPVILPRVPPPPGEGSHSRDLDQTVPPWHGAGGGVSR